MTTLQPPHNPRSPLPEHHTPLNCETWTAGLTLDEGFRVILGGIEAGVVWRLYGDPDIERLIIDIVSPYDDIAHPRRVIGKPKPPTNWMGGLAVDDAYRVLLRAMIEGVVHQILLDPGLEGLLRALTDTE